MMISDLSQRQTALDTTRSFIVQAPAGSGKTGLLVYRLLALLAEVKQPQEVLAITFTRKATAEMRERLLELLYKAESKQSSEDSFEQQGIDLAKRVLLNDQRWNWRLLDAPHQLQLLTIDSFCAKLSGDMPWLSRLGDRPRVTDDATSHYRMAIERLLQVLVNGGDADQTALKSVLFELDFNYNKARELFATLLAKRDQWLRHLLQGDLSDNRPNLESAWQTIVDESADRLQQLMPDELQQELYELACIGRKVLGISDSDQANTPAVKLRCVADLLLTQSDTLSKKVNKKQGFLAGEDSTKRLNQLLAELQGDADLEAALVEFRSLPSPQFSNESWRLLLALDEVLKRLAAELQLRFRATGECDHSEVTQRAALALRELNQPSELGLRLDAEIKHILVDEFQDTSLGQIELLKGLTQGWGIELQDHRTLFLVGDPMQSIYRFREAEVGLFLQVADNDNTQIFANINIEALSLSENFRSSSALVNWFNQVFKQSFPKRNDVTVGAIQYSLAKSSRSGIEQPVTTFLFENKEQEAQGLVNTVQQAIATAPEGAKVAVLVRSRTHLQYLLPALDEADIGYSGIDINPLAQTQEVLDVLSLCRAICRPQDRIAWLSILRAPWCGLTLSDLECLNKDQERTIWECLQNWHELNLSDVAQRQIPRFIEVLAQALQEYQACRLSQLLRWVWEQLGGPHTLEQVSLEDIEQVFSAIRECESGGQISAFRDLERALDGLYANPPVQDNSSLVVSTMHKSKGLQYHTVILPGLGNQARSDSKDVLMWSELQDNSGQARLLLAPLMLNNDGNLHYEFLRNLESKRAQHELARLLYVAVTRAEQRLVLMANLKTDKDGSQPRKPIKSALLASVWAELEQDFTYSEISSTRDQVQPLEGHPLRRFASPYVAGHAQVFDWQSKQQLVSEMQTSDGVEFEWAGDVAKAVGIILHDFMQHQGSSILSIHPDDQQTKRWQRQLEELRVPAERHHYALERLHRALSNIQEHQEAHFLFQDYPEAQNELALSYYDGSQVREYRVDRTFVDADGVRWIVDYKSTETNRSDLEAFAKSQVEERHKPQMQGYGELFKVLEQSSHIVSIRLAVYFPLLKQLVHWRYH